MRAAVAYGHGSEFYATVRDLPRVCHHAGVQVVEYFGDLDARGLEIPYGAAATLRVEAPHIELRPAARWYAELLKYADRAREADRCVDLTSPILSWLPDALRQAGHDLLSRGRRLPQEHVGLECLRGT